MAVSNPIPEYGGYYVAIMIASSFLCCNRVYWTLYDVDLKRNSIRYHNSLAGDISKLEEVVSAIKERLAYAIDGWESPNRDFTMVSGVSEGGLPSLHIPFQLLKICRHPSSKRTVIIMGSI